MELVERMGGLGRVRLTEEENKALEELLHLFEKEGKQIYYAPGREGISLGNYSPQRSKLIQAIASTLFPFASERTFANRFSSAYLVNNATNVGRGVYDKITLGLGLALSLKYNSYEGRLHLLKPSEDRGSLVVVTMSVASYEPDVVDDLATMLGKTYQSPLVGPRPIDNEDLDLNRKYGLADLPRFKEVQKLYERSAEVINSEKWSVVKDHPLNLLRKDSLEHPNLAVREASQQMYHRKLAELLLG